MTEKMKLNRIKVVLAGIEIAKIDLVKALNINQAIVSHWCINETQPSIETLFEISRILKTEPSDLLRTTL